MYFFKLNYPSSHDELGRIWWNRICPWILFADISILQSSHVSGADCKVGLSKYWELEVCLKLAVLVFYFEYFIEEANTLVQCLQSSNLSHIVCYNFIRTTTSMLRIIYYLNPTSFPYPYSPFEIVLVLFVIDVGTKAKIWCHSHRWF